MKSRTVINGDTKSVSTPLALHFKLKAIMSLITVEECEYMTHVPYTSVVGSLMYAIVCTRSNLSQVVSNGKQIHARSRQGSLGGSKVDSTIHQRYHRR